MPPKKICPASETTAASAPRSEYKYKLADAIPLNTILVDITKNRWKLGPPVGRGAFGEVYSVSAANEGADADDYCYVAKIEPHCNGPLFVEINFYLRYAKPEHVAAYQEKRGIKTLGLPVYYGSGSIIHNETKYRFLIIQKFGSDLEKLFKLNNNIFPTDTVFKTGIQLVDVIQYVHECGYVHCDIKTPNIMTDSNKESDMKQVYLIDFGLVCRYSVNKEYEPNPARAHGGTIDYISRDGHKGVHTRRGDLEVLAYNILQWLGCTLPWENPIFSYSHVQHLKEQYMASVSGILQGCFGNNKHPKAIMDFLIYLETLQHDSAPDYNKIREIFTSGVIEGGGTIGTTLNFSTVGEPSGAELLKPRRIACRPASRLVCTQRTPEAATLKPKHSKRGRKRTSNGNSSGNSKEVDGSTDLKENPAKRGKKETGKKDDDKTEKPEKWGSKKAGRKGKENQVVDISPRRLKSKGILKGREQDMDAPGTKSASINQAGPCL